MGKKANRKQIKELLKPLPPIPVLNKNFQIIGYLNREKFFEHGEKQGKNPKEIIQTWYEKYESIMGSLRKRFIKIPPDQPSSK